MRQHADRIYHARFDANPNVDSAQLRAEAEHAALVYDSYIRNQAYHSQIVPEKLYERFEMDWMSGKIYDRKLQEALDLRARVDGVEAEIGVNERRLAAGLDDPFVRSDFETALADAQTRLDDLEWHQTVKDEVADLVSRKKAGEKINENELRDLRKELKNLKSRTANSISKRNAPK